MACLHKFKEYLSLEKLDFEPATLIVGTFNPSWPESNQAQWFYGRTANNYFWDVLPQVYGRDSLIDRNPDDWKKFCKEQKIALTDLIASIRDANPDNEDHIAVLKDFSDSGITSKFSQFELVDILELLKNHPSIKKVYFTRSSSELFWKNLWKPVREYINTKGILFAELLTPSGNARFQHGKYKKVNPAVKVSLPGYILMRWKEVIK